MSVPRVIGVIGAGSCNDRTAEIAREVGRRIAEAGCVLICGGLGGVMEAACRGASDGGGLTIGILPGDAADAANPYVRIPIVTGLGAARNVIIVRSSSVLIAIAGGPGTLSEIAFALQFGVPVVSLGSHTPAPEIVVANDPEHAVREAFRIAEQRGPLSSGRPGLG
jgi:uncharacterized protein (TIGR00725 family)